MLEEIDADFDHFSIPAGGVNANGIKKKHLEGSRATSTELFGLKAPLNTAS